jgi:hypothetical protein
VGALDADIRSELHTPADRRIAAFVAAHHGVIARRHLIAIGLSHGAIDHRVESGRLIALHRGVYAVGHANLTPKGHWLGAVYACGERALLAYQSAAALSDIASTSRPLIDVVRPTGSGRPPRGVHIHRSRIITPADRAEIDGIPVTSIPRTLLDLADVLSLHSLELAVETAERKHLLNMAAMIEVLERSNGRHGVKRLMATLSLPSGAIDTRSPLERRFLRFCDEHGIPRPQVNAMVAGFEVDAYFPKAKLVVELDSVAYHHTRGAFERDREKDIALQLAGQRVVRVTHKRMQGAARELAAELRALIAA